MASSPHKLVLDVSLTLNLRGRIASGIPRVEESVAEALLRRTDIELAFCRYRSRHNAFQYVPAQTVREALAQPRINASPYWPPSKNGMLRHLGRALEKGWRRHVFPPSDLVRWSPDRVFVSVGAWWNSNYDSSLRAMFGHPPARKILMCHDTIPLQFPDYFEDREAGSRFRSGLTLISTADLVLCNSQMTKRDLLEVLSTTFLPVPPMMVVSLPPGILPDRTPEQPPLDAPDGDFVLMVGSVSRRKNQIMLCDVWSRLARDPSVAGVKLILVGAWSDHSAEVHERLQSDRALDGRVIVRNDITDSELAWLYRHCLFTVYPSHYEGWGLPIGESLGFGKLCVASDTSAMPDAGQGLCLHLPPHDTGRWYDTMRELLSDRSRLSSYEKEIAARYRMTNWDDVIDGISYSLR